ncbi:ABC transporter ATP-binding protein [Legionella impletisoli]|nr:ABC transporter ATP-binding protein [Legionella impletisoli]
MNTVLKGLSLTIHQGELVAIVGPSGSGKSTLMNIIGLLDKPSSGIYALNGQDTAGLSPDELALLRNQHIGFIFQQFNLLPRFTALQNVGLPLTYRNVSDLLINQRVERALMRVNMRDFSSHRPNQLSGGQQQRVAIARALVTDPNVILADEPTGALDSKTGKEIMNLFLALHQEGRTIIIVTHDEKIADLCTRKIVLADGEIIRQQ